MHTHQPCCVALQVNPTAVQPHHSLSGSAPGDAAGDLSGADAVLIKQRSPESEEQGQPGEQPVVSCATARGMWLGPAVRSAALAVGCPGSGLPWQWAGLAVGCLGLHSGEWEWEWGLSASSAASAGFEALQGSTVGLNTLTGEQQHWLLGITARSSRRAPGVLDACVRRLLWSPPVSPSPGGCTIPESQPPSMWPL